MKQIGDFRVADFINTQTAKKIPRLVKFYFQKKADANKNTDLLENGKQPKVW